MTNNSQFLREPDATTTNPAFAARIKQMLLHQNETTKAMCDNPTEETVKDMMRARSEVQNEICDVHANIDDVVFTKQSNKVWTSNSGEPTGLCGSIDIKRLIQNSTSDGDWTYEVRTINTKPEGPLCGGKAESTEKFSWTVDSGARECAWVVIY